MNLVHPAEEHLTSYMDALDRGWSADTHRPDARLDEMMRITADPVGFPHGPDRSRGSGGANHAS
jgi:hypothetical protein